MYTLLIILSGLLLISQTPAPHEKPASSPAQVLVLGVTHFAGSGDVVQGAQRDILGEAAQAQIQSVTQALARFKPDRIVLEYPASAQAERDALYQNYRDGRRGTSKNERDQLGFRLAQRLGHERVHAFDHSSVMDFGSLMMLAQETGRPELIATFEQRIGRITEWSDELTAHATISEEFAVLNDPRYDDASHRLYMDLLAFDTAERQPARELLTAWYDRNLKMHASLRRIAEPGERILIFVGAAHTKHLRDFVRQDLTMTSIEPAAYLPKAPAGQLEKFLAIATSAP